ncbi:hypothetical protein ALC53_07416 [Atta colombica]|uniref:Uncharacterized protein n=1 Tax=Atta colombica TaxID=520822 RepID=A0A195BC93_9HYME|nr:hypothetical protein ALC53_07416 [Atta colombica]
MAVQESGAQAVECFVPPTKAHWSMKSFAGPPFAKSSSMRALLATSSRRGYLLSVILAFVNVYCCEASPHKYLSENCRGSKHLHIIGLPLSSPFSDSTVFKIEPGKCSFDVPSPGRVNSNINGGLIQRNAGGHLMRDADYTHP